MLDLEVVPEQGLQADNEQWEILLGMHFSQAVAIVQSQVHVIKSAHVVYNDQTPLSHDLILDLPQDGLRLMFDSKSQRLKMIEVYNLRLARLKYCNTVFNGPEVTPSVEQIDRCFGATRPGSYDKQRHLFALNFRGLTFFFPVDLQYQPHYSHGLGSLRFPGDSSPVLSRMILYSGNNPPEAPVPPLPAACYRGHVYCDECFVMRNSCGNRTLGLRLRLFTHSNNILEPTRVNFEREILFGEFAQSVQAKLGTPSRIYYKADDKMKIHSREAHKRNNSKSDYFFNYLTLGLDVLFDARSHKAIKFILHTNYPGHYDFNSYHRCPFSLRIGRTPSSNMITITSPPPSINLTTGNHNKSNKSQNNQSKSPKIKKNGTNNGNNKMEKLNNCQDISGPATINTSSMNNTDSTLGDKHWISVKYDTLWEELSDFAGDSKDRFERPVVLTRSSSNNPFGSSLCYGIQDMIFEVMSNDHIGSVTLYQIDS